MKFYKLFSNPTKKLILCFQRSFFLLRSFRVLLFTFVNIKKCQLVQLWLGLRMPKWNEHFRGEMSEIQSSLIRHLNQFSRLTFNCLRQSWTFLSRGQISFFLLWSLAFFPSQAHNSENPATFCGCEQNSGSEIADLLLTLYAPLLLKLLGSKFDSFIASDRVHINFRLPPLFRLRAFSWLYVFLRDHRCGIVRQ